MSTTAKTQPGPAQPARLLQSGNKQVCTCTYGVSKGTSRAQHRLELVFLGHRVARGLDDPSAAGLIEPPIGYVPLGSAGFRWISLRPDLVRNLQVSSLQSSLPPQPGLGTFPNPRQNPFVDLSTYGVIVLLFQSPLA